MHSLDQSSILFEKAQRVIPGGVNSPVRAFHGVGGTPVFFSHAEGAYLFDEDGNEYIDYVGSWGPMILGHRHPKVIEALRKQLDKAVSFGAPTQLEIELCELICSLMPSIDMVRLVNSGTEATMSALRLARAYTARDKIIKFEGCYHGHSDSLLVKAGSGALTLGVPSSPGVPKDISQHTLNAIYNDLSSVKALFEAYPNEIAAIILEPIAGNMNCIPATNEFIQGLRELCNQYQTVLIFDEVMTGFRVALGGAQSLYNVKPDLTTLGKIIGGGLPVGAFGGKRDIMQLLAPVGPVYQAGTLSGNPLAVTAGLATLNQLHQSNFYENLAITTQKLTQEAQSLAKTRGIPFTAQCVGSMFGLFFTERTTIANYQQSIHCNLTHFKSFFHTLLNAGIYIAPAMYEAGFVSAAHGEKEIDKTLCAIDAAFKKLQ